MNGYFQIQIDKKGVSVILIPPVEGGENIRVAELKEYLNIIALPYDAMAINAALYSLENKEAVVFLNSVKRPPVREICTITTAADSMTAVLRLYPPSAGGAQLSKAQILEELQKAKIKFGIDEEAIRKLLEKREYCTDIIVAKGQPLTAGKDAEIVYYFDKNNEARPELKEDGNVDFFKLNTLHNCLKGQVLAEMIPEERGQNGIDVFGKVSPAREVKKAKFSFGRNLEISPDGRQLISMVDGHVSLVDDKVFVSDVYSVEDVSTATGNIDYQGDVEVKGNVCENFSVKTRGNVFVQGVVEGATIEAGGNIVIARGMHGQNKGKLKAGGNVIAKFISAAQVETGGYVEAEQILNAKVNAGTSVFAETGKGLITGGKVTAKSSVNVKNAGSPMGTATIIEVGADPEAKKRLVALQKGVGEKSKNISELRKMLDNVGKILKTASKPTVEQIKKFKTLQETLTNLQAQLQEDLKEIERLDSMLKGEGNAYINVKGTMYQGVVVGISGATMTVKNEYIFCRLVKKGADIASTNL